MGRGGQMRKEDPTHAAKIFGSKLRLFSVKAFNAKNDEAEKKKKTAELLTCIPGIPSLCKH